MNRWSTCSPTYMVANIWRLIPSHARMLLLTLIIIVILVFISPVFCFPFYHSVLIELGQIKNKQQPFTFELFSRFCKTYHGMLFKAFELQHTLRERICGFNFWKYCSAYRTEKEMVNIITFSFREDRPNIYLC